jgi:hypothetical protein
MITEVSSGREGTSQRAIRVVCDEGEFLIRPSIQPKETDDGYQLSCVSSRRKPQELSETSIQELQSVLATSIQRSKNRGMAELVVGSFLAGPRDETRDISHTKRRSGGD